MIDINGVVFETQSGDFFRRKNKILKNISFHIPANEIFAIIGPNGAGKSTFLKLILSFIQPTSGSITLSNSTSIGFLPENPYYYDYLTLKELIWFSAKSYGMTSSLFHDEIYRVIERVGLSDHLNKKLRKFSKGMTQRAGIAAAIIHNPELVILDEPMTGLDPLGRKMVFDLVKDLKNEGKTILFCSHILSDVERLCDKVAIMNQGEIKKILTMEDLVLAQKAVEIIVDTGNKTEGLLRSSGYQFRINDRYGSIYVDTSELNSALQYLAANKLTIEAIKASNATLENIFYETVRGKEARSCGL